MGKRLRPPVACRERLIAVGERWIRWHSETSRASTYFLPELVLAAAVVVLLPARPGGQRQGDRSATWRCSRSRWSLILIGARCRAGDERVAVPTDAIVLDAFAVFFSVLLALAALAAVWMSLGSRESAAPATRASTTPSCSPARSGMYLMASATNLLMAYLSLEFVSLTSYVLTGFLRHNRRSSEAR